MTTDTLAYYLKCVVLPAMVTLAWFGISAIGDMTQRQPRAVTIQRERDTGADKTTTLTIQEVTPYGSLEVNSSDGQRIV